MMSKDPAVMKAEARSLAAAAFTFYGRWSDAEKAIGLTKRTFQNYLNGKYTPQKSALRALRAWARDHHLPVAGGHDVPQMTCRGLG